SCLAVATICSSVSALQGPLMMNGLFFAGNQVVIESCCNTFFISNRFVVYVTPFGRCFMGFCFLQAGLSFVLYRCLPAHRECGLHRSLSCVGPLRPVSSDDIGNAEGA